MNSQQNASSGKGTFVAIALCVGFYLLWTQYLQKKYPDYNKRDTTEQQASTTTPATTPAVPAAAAPAKIAAQPTSASIPKMAERDLMWETPDAVYTFSQELGSPTSIKLKKYQSTNDANSDTAQLLERPFSVQAFAANPPAQTGPQAFTGTRSSKSLSFSRVEGPWKIDQTWTMPESGYAVKVQLSFTNTSAEAKPLTATVLTEIGAPEGETTSSFFAPAQPGEAPRFLTQIDGSDDFKNISEFCKDQSLTVASKDQKLDFFGFDTHYFAAALIPNGKASYRTNFIGKGTPNNPLCEILTTSTVDLATVAPGATASVVYDAWFGPKEVELLSAFNPRLKTTLGLGWLDMIAHPLLLAIKGLYKFLGNYGLAIIALTLLLKILFYPLTKQAAISAARMKKLNPEMQKLRERYKNDQQRMQMELMKFMSTNKINPMKGCLPILPQIPVFFALFRVLSASIELRHAPFYGWITDLSTKDPYYITPIILTGCMFVQQKLTPMTGMDKTQERVFMFMPLIFGVMMITLPSGLVLYMLTNTIVSIAQQQYLNRKLANA